MATTFDRVRDLLVEQLGVDEEEVAPDATIIGDLGADSLDAVEIVMAVEEAFGLEIPDETCAEWTTVKEIVDYVEQQAQKK